MLQMGLLDLIEIACSEVDSALKNVPGSYVSQKRNSWLMHFICNEPRTFVAAVTTENGTTPEGRREKQRG